MLRMCQAKVANVVAPNLKQVLLDFLVVPNHLYISLIVLQIVLWLHHTWPHPTQEAQPSHLPSTSCSINNHEFPFPDWKLWTMWISQLSSVWCEAVTLVACRSAVGFTLALRDSVLTREVFSKIKLFIFGILSSYKYTFFCNKKKYFSGWPERCFG